MPWLKFISPERDRCPANRCVYIIQDNLSAHCSPEMRACARENNFSIAPTAANAGWINHVECNAGDEDHAFTGTNFTDWWQGRWAFEKAVNCRNKKGLKRTMRFRNTQDGSGKHTKPLWKSH